ncbi:unnamed protein product [Rotaria sp. Silwood2]|nr:unnamed protein product [Rotaria sp. Silwood2]CAF2816397.1 unnamed protein product [Rotaria sp. Silwood2]CAF3343644.1 unnamed protein product [Rotaria sp. Silwood2]CAF4038839.1 unnamed protein product [Rotaria sp. Silwood2]CAF4618260.1 unnamed protein product [Rotaria sp. Silwood2]
MDEFNTFTSKPSTTEETDLFGFGNTDEITNIQKDDSSWIIENISNMKTSSSSDILDETSPVHPSNDIWNNINSSEVLNSFNDDVFTNEEPLNTLPPTAEDILSNDLSNQQKGL